MFRKLIVIFMALAAVAAQAASTNGEGVARDPFGRPVNFRFAAHSDPVTGVDGAFNMRAVSPAGVVMAEVALPHVMRLHVFDNHARFGGPGSLTVRTNTGDLRTVRGMVSVEVVDNAGLNIPDRIIVRFGSFMLANGWGFNGLVTAGDIVVTP